MAAVWAVRVFFLIIYRVNQLKYVYASMQINPIFAEIFIFYWTEIQWMFSGIFIF